VFTSIIYTGGIVSDDDVIQPIINEVGMTNPSTVQSNETFTVWVNVTESSGIYSQYIEWWYNSESHSTDNMTLDNQDGDHYYYKYILSPAGNTRESGQFHWIVHVTDNDNDRTGDRLYDSFTGTDISITDDDIIAPVIESTSTSSSIDDSVSQPYVLYAQVSDDLSGIGSVEFKWDIGAQVYTSWLLGTQINATHWKYEISYIEWTAEIANDASGKIVNYCVQVTDADNSPLSSFVNDVVGTVVSDDDVDAPTYSTITPANNTVFYDVNVQSGIEVSIFLYDTKSVDSVTVEFRYRAGIGSWDIWTTWTSNAGDEYNFTIPASFLNTNTGETIYWQVQSSDTDNSPTQSVSNEYFFNMQDDDTSGPEISSALSGIVYDNSALWNSVTNEINITVDVTDFNTGDSDINEVRLYYGPSWNYYVMTGTGYGQYSYTVTIALDAIFSYFITSYDNDDDRSPIDDKTMSQLGSDTVPITVEIRDDDTDAPTIMSLYTTTGAYPNYQLVFECVVDDDSELGAGYLYLSQNGSIWESGISTAPVDGVYTWQIIVGSEYSEGIHYYVTVWDDDNDRSGDNLTSDSLNKFIPVLTAGTFYYSEGSLVIECVGTFTEFMIESIDVNTNYYKYLHLDVVLENITDAEVELLTASGTELFSMPLDGNWTCDLSLLNTIVSSVTIRIMSNEVDKAILIVDDIVFSPISKPIRNRVSVNVEYETVSGSTILVMDDYLLSWDSGLVALDTGSVVVSRVETEVLDWTSQTLVVSQHLVDYNVSVNVVVKQDGTVDISVDTEGFDMVFALKTSCDKYSDSFGVIDTTSSDVNIRTPAFAAMYSGEVGFGVVDLTNETVASSVQDSLFIVDCNVDDNIVLIPLLYSRFELISGVEVDPNFIVSYTNMDASGLLSHWIGGSESQNVAFWDGEFYEDHALRETFTSQGAWVIDNEGQFLSTEDAVNKTRIECTKSRMNVTISAENPEADTVVLKLNYLSIKPADNPFIRFIIDGTGDLQVSLKLNLTGEATLFTIYNSLDPQSETRKETNLYYDLEQSGLETKTIQGIEIWLEETVVDLNANKTVFLDELIIYRINGWDMVLTINTSTNSIAKSNGNKLALVSDPNKEIRLRREFTPALDSVTNRIFQWRERVGYSSTINITAVNSAESSYTFEDDSTNWAIITNDISASGDVEAIEITLEAGTEECEGRIL
jgi:hypothetical protein